MHKIPDGSAQKRPQLVFLECGIWSDLKERCGNLCVITLETLVCNLTSPTGISLVSFLFQMEIIHF